MDITTGQTYESIDMGVAKGVPRENLVEVTGTEAQIQVLSSHVRLSVAQREKRATLRKTQRNSRKRNRR